MKFKIKLDVIRSQLIIYFLSYDKFIKKCKETFPDDEENDYPEAFTIENNLFFKDSEKDVSIFAHELIHGITYISEYLGLKDEEFMAYTMEYCLNKILKKRKIEIK